MNPLCVVLSTTNSMTSANDIASALVDRQLAACVQIVPGIRSVYRWEGNVVSDEEIQLIIKTTSTVLDEAYRIVCEMHPYDLPEWVVLDSAKASQDYLTWANKATTRSNEDNH